MMTAHEHDEPGVAELLAGGAARIASWPTAGERQHRRMTSADVGHLLAGLRDGDRWRMMPTGPYRLLLCRYVEPTPRDVRLLMAALTRDCEPVEGWLARQPYWTYCRIAVTEYLSPDACPVCEGVGHRAVEAAVVACDACGGVGRRAWTVRQRADALEVARSTWHGGPAERAYLERLRRLVQWDSDGLGWLARRGRGRLVV